MIQGHLKGNASYFRDDEIIYQEDLNKYKVFCT